MQSVYKGYLRKGFTLTEVLVTSVILGFILSGVAIVLVLNSRLSSEGVAEAFLQVTTLYAKALLT